MFSTIALHELNLESHSRQADQVPCIAANIQTISESAGDVLSVSERKWYLRVSLSTLFPRQQVFHYCVDTTPLSCFEKYRLKR